MIRLFLFILFTISLQAQQNVVVILADDLGYNDLSSTGHSSYQTPIVDSLRANGLVFNRFYVAPACTPTRGAFMTGKYPHNIKLQNSVIWAAEDRRLPLEEKTIAQHFQEVGYATAMYGKWHLGNTRPQDLPHVRGFDHFRGFATPASSYVTKHSLAGKYSYMEDGELVITDTYMDTDLVDDAKEWISFQAQDTTSPFFIYYAPFSPHTPYAAGYSRQETVEKMDEEIGRLWQHLIDEGVGNNTIILFTTDNGTDKEDDPNNVFRGNKATVGEGGIRSCASWYHPAHINSGDTLDSVVSIIDLLPTFMDIANNEVDSIDGQSFASLLGYSNSQAWIGGRKYIAHYIPDRLYAVIQGDWKLANNIDASIRYNGTLTEDLTLYNLANDPDESEDILSSNQSIADSLEQAVTGLNVTNVSVSESTDINGLIYWAIPSWFYSDINPFKP